MCRRRKSPPLPTVLVDVVPEGLPCLGQGGFPQSHSAPVKHAVAEGNESREAGPGRMSARVAGSVESCRESSSDPAKRWPGGKGWAVTESVLGSPWEGGSGSVSNWGDASH